LPCRDLQKLRVPKLRGKGTKTNGRNKKTWSEYVKIKMKRLDLVKYDANILDKWRNLTTGNCPTLPQCGNEGVVL